MSEINYVTVALTHLAMQLPLLAVSITGLIYALRGRMQHPRAYRWAAWGFSCLIAYSCVQVIARYSVVALASRMVEQNIMTAEAMVWVNMLTVIAYPFFIVGVSLLARSIFLGRESREGGGSRDEPVPHAP